MPVFIAPSHPFLVPFDGSFDARHARTVPPNKNSKSKDWKDFLEPEIKKMGDTQYRLFADGRYGVLLIFQALDAAGKDGTIRHVFAGVNPCGLHVTSFKQPSRTELAHDFLWRTTAALPERGSVAVFNRSYYEEVLVVRVHPELLAAQRVATPPSPTLWAERYRAIVEHERHLAEQGTVILKFWLNISKAEQRERLLERIDEADKHWKFRAGDLDERDHWDAYLDAYHDCLNATSQPWAPWYAVPADNKHYLRWQVAVIVNAVLDTLGVDFPQLGDDEQAALARSKARLLVESS